MRIYVSGAFIGSLDLENAQREYEHLAVLLRQAGFDVYLPHLHTSPLESSGLSAREVYERDIKELYASDLVIALLNEPSHGVGAELSLALTHRLPIMGFGFRGKNVSRFLRGMLESSESGEYFEYEDLEEVFEKVVALSEFKRESGLGRNQKRDCSTSAA
jgi:nucleoside 2-deoxyribosyltransferase